MGDEDPNPPEDEFPLDAAGEPAAHMEVDEELVDGGEENSPEFPLNAAAVVLAIAEQIGAEDANRARA